MNATVMESIEQRGADLVKTYSNIFLSLITLLVFVLCKICEAILSGVEKLEDGLKFMANYADDEVYAAFFCSNILIIMIGLLAWDVSLDIYLNRHRLHRFCKRTCVEGFVKVCIAIVLITIHARHMLLDFPDLPTLTQLPSSEIAKKLWWMTLRESITLLFISGAPVTLSWAAGYMRKKVQRQRPGEERPAHAQGRA